MRMTAMKDTMSTLTWMCENGYHGSADRRSAVRNDGAISFTGMYQGTCAGTMLHADTRTEEPCACTCHSAPFRLLSPDAFE